MDLSRPSAPEAVPPAANNIILTIDTLVLEGVPPHQGNRVAEALTTELTRLLTEQGLPPRYQQGQTVPQVTAPFQPRPGLSPEQMGTQLAQAIYRGLDA